MSSLRPLGTSPAKSFGAARVSAAAGYGWPRIRRIMAVLLPGNKAWSRIVFGWLPESGSSASATEEAGDAVCACRRSARGIRRDAVKLIPPSGGQ